MASDLDGDGIPDIAVGAPTLRAGDDSNGAVFLLSGATLEILYIVRGEAGQVGFGLQLLSAPDCDGDEHGEVLITDYAGSVAVMSSGRRTVLRVLSCGGPVHGMASDGDSDGVPDLACGGHLISLVTGRRVGEIDLADCQLVTYCSAPARRMTGVEGRASADGAKWVGGSRERQYYSVCSRGDSRTRSLCAVGDLDGDDRLEVVTLINNEAAFETLLSVASHSREMTIAKGYIATSVTIVPDLDGDRNSDLVVGSRESFGGLIIAYNGVSLVPIWTRECRRGSTTVLAMPDIDGDGVADLVVGSGDWNPDSWFAAPDGEVALISGQDGTTVYQVTEALVDQWAVDRFTDR